jgi:hypothetical protein
MPQPKYPAHSVPTSPPHQQHNDKYINRDILAAHRQKSCASLWLVTFGDTQKGKNYDHLNYEQD